MPRTVAILASLCASPAAAQPLANPASFGTGLGALTVGTILGLLVFIPLKNKGFELRWRRGKPLLGQAVAAAGAFLGLAIFYIVVFKM